jgi:hypothetical protein
MPVGRQGNRMECAIQHRPISTRTLILGFVPGIQKSNARKPVVSGAGGAALPDHPRQTGGVESDLVCEGETLITLSIMVGAMVAAWVGLCFPQTPGPDLRSAIQRVRRQTLSCGIIILTALMPAILIASAVYRRDHSLALPTLLGIESSLCLVLAVLRARHVERLESEWQSRIWNTASRNGVV